MYFLLPFFLLLFSSFFFILLLLSRARYLAGAAGVVEFYNSRFGWREAFCRRAFGIYRP